MALGSFSLAQWEIFAFSSSLRGLSASQKLQKLTNLDTAILKIRSSNQQKSVKMFDWYIFHENICKKWISKIWNFLRYLKLKIAYLQTKSRSVGPTQNIASSMPKDPLTYQKGLVLLTFTPVFPRKNVISNSKC